VANRNRQFHLGPSHASARRHRVADDHEEIMELLAITNWKWTLKNRQRNTL
jgi:hypothetical protein